MKQEQDTIGRTYREHKTHIEVKNHETSGRDGGVGRLGSPPRTTTSKLTKV